MSNFFERAGIVPSEPEQPEPVDPATIPQVEWGARRGELGLPSTSDFVGVEGWSRGRAVRHVHREETAMERYAAERAELGVPDAPTSTAAQQVREFAAAQQAAQQLNSPRNRSR